MVFSLFHAKCQGDNFTELFSASDNDLAFSTLTFTPNGSSDFYTACRDPAASFPTDPTGGTTLSLSDDSYVQITLSSTNTVSLYGIRTNLFFIGSNGYLTLYSGDTTWNESFANHFNLPRVSALFHDLNPGVGGTISWKQLSDRVAVTYQDVPTYVSSDPNSFQIELFADGRIRLTYLTLNCLNNLVGLSAGQGVPAGFAESDFTSYGSCPVLNDVSIALTCSANPVAVGASLTYYITVTNTGPTTATGVVVTNFLPAAVNFVSASSSQGTCMRNGNLVICNLGSVPAATNASATIVVTPVAAGILRDVATVTRGELDAVPGNNIAELLVEANRPPHGTTFASSGPISIPTFGAATPYPSTNVVAGFTDAVAKVTVTVSNLAHSWPSDISLLLVGPGGQNVMLMAGAGGSYGCTNVTLTFDDEAGVMLPSGGQITSGTVIPTSFNPSATLPAPAPAPPFSGTLSVFSGVDPNGSWKLFAYDDSLGDSGSINNGWSLNLFTFFLPPVITTQPGSQMALLGTNATLSVVADGFPSPAYQWFFNGVSIPGATDSSLTLSNVQPTNAGNYTVLVSNSLGSVTSAVAVLTVLTSWQLVTIPGLPPETDLVRVWARNPNEVYVWGQVGTNATPNGALYRWDGANWTTPLVVTGQWPSSVFGVGASESFAATATNVWRSTDNGLTWVRQSLPSLPVGYSYGKLSGTANNVHLQAGWSDASSYAYGAIVRFDGTSWQIVYLWTTPTFQHHAPATLSVFAANEGYFVGCWGWGKWDGSAWNFNGVQFDFCDISDTWAMRDAGGNLRWWVVGNNNFSNGIKVWCFDTNTMSFVCKSCYCFSDGNDYNIGGASGIWASSANDVYVIGALASVSSGPRSGRVYHYDGSTWSRVAAVGDIYPLGIWGISSSDVWVSGLNGRLLHLMVGPSITAQPQSQIVAPGANAAFGVTAAGTAPLNYQWQFNGANIGAATNSSLVLSNVQFANAGSYTVIVTNSSGSITSAVAILTVAVPLPLRGVTYLGSAGADLRGTGIKAIAGALYVIGNSTISSGFIARFEPPLTPGTPPVWVTNWPDANPADTFRGVAASASGIYIAGGDWTRTVDTVGDKETKGLIVKFPFAGAVGGGYNGASWDRQTPAPPGAFSYGGSEGLNALTLANESGTNFIYATGGGQRDFFSGGRLYVSKVAEDSTVLWTRTDGAEAIGENRSVGSAVTAMNGNVFAAGSVEGVLSVEQPYLRKYDPAGSLIWIRTNSVIGGYAGITSISNSLYAVGYGGTDTNTDFLVDKWDENGNLQWSRTYDRAGAQDALTGAAALGGHLYAVGYTRGQTAGGADAILMEVDPATGNLISTTPFGGSQDDMANGLDTDGVNLYVVGETRSFGNGSNQMMVLEYSPAARPVLTNLVVTPSNAIISTLQQQQFAAMGQFSDGSSQPLPLAVSWSRVATNGTIPPRRAEGSSICDPTSDAMVIFAGNVNRCTFDTPYNDVWMLSHATGQGGDPTWQQLSPAGTLPSARMGPQAVYSPASDRMVVFGGDLTCGCSKLNDLWILTNATTRGGSPGWVQISPVGGPPAARNDQAAVYDAANNRMTIFGGFYCTVNLNDVWVLVNADGTTGTPQWIQLAPTGTPPIGRLTATGVYDPASNRMIIFGGTQCCSYPRPYYNDVWVLTFANGLGGTPQWIQLNPTGTLPSGRNGHIAQYDPTTKRMIVFAGNPGPGNDVWVLSNADGTTGTPQWQQLSAGGSIPAERGGENGQPFSAYDPVSNRLTIFGGGTSGTPNTTNDTYVLVNANAVGGLSWSSGNSNVATVSSNGVASPVNQGQTTIIATSDGITGSAGLVITNILPFIITQPTNQTVVLGGSVMFAVQAGGTPPLSYQWRFNGTNILGATSSTYGLVNTQPANAGNYIVVVTNSLGSVTSAVATLAVLSTSVWQQVTMPNLPPGTDLTSVWTRNQNDLYVWGQVSTNPIPNATLYRWDGANWTSPLVVTGQWPGSLFGVGASEVFAAVTTNVWRSTDNGLTWVQQSLPSLPVGYSYGKLSGTTNNVHLQAGWSDASSYAYGAILRFDGTIWQTAYAWTNAAFQHHAPGPLSVFAPNEGYFVGCWGWGKWDGNAWSFNGVQFDFCDVYDTWAVRDAGSNLHWWAVGNNNFSNGIRIWCFDTNTMSFVCKSCYCFGDGNNYNIGSAYRIWGSDANDVYVIGALASVSSGARSGRVYHFDGGVWSQVTAVGDIYPLGIWGTSSSDVWISGQNARLIHLMLGAPPSITAQPQSITNVVGATAAFGVTAVGTLPLSYQWCFNGSSITGATNSNLALANVQPTNAGSYTVVVSNVLGSVTSSNATLTVDTTVRLSLIGFTTNSFHFRLTGPVGIYVLQASTNLVNWVPIATNATTQGGILDFSDANAINFTRRFYRALQQ